MLLLSTVTIACLLSRPAKQCQAHRLSTSNLAADAIVSATEVALGIERGPLRAFRNADRFTTFISFAGRALFDDVARSQIGHRKSSGLNPLPSMMLLNVPTGIGLFPCM